jgi:hypothetical protein
MSGSTDDPLLSSLRRITSEVDPPPALTRELGYAAFDLRNLEAQLAELSWDSVLGGEELAGTRGRTDLRMMTFETPQLAIELQVSQRGGRRTLLGQVVGDDPVEVTVEGDAGCRKVEVDDLGTFRAEDLASGRTRLHVTTASGSTVTTSWVTI